MSEPQPKTARTCHYFVDEAGDGILFNKKKQIVVGREGCSQCFILGVLEVSDAAKSSQELHSLRASLCADPYLRKVPSMQLERRKTALAFHAKDDCAEVRREVYRALMQHDARFFAIVRHKRTIVKKVQEHNKKHPEYRYHPNQLYDRCVSRLFRDRLHKEDSYVIQFSRRGNRSRTEALKKALEQARNNIRLKWGIAATAPIEVLASTPRESGGLQAVDYFLWALQRLYERGEDRYWEYVAEKVSLVYDVDDTREKEYGAYYTKKNPLTLDECKKKSWKYEDPLTRITRHEAEVRFQLYSDSSCYGLGSQPNSVTWPLGIRPAAVILRKWMSPPCLTKIGRSPSPSKATDETPDSDVRHSTFPALALAARPSRPNDSQAASEKRA